jgi:hypothetical protein
MENEKSLGFITTTPTPAFVNRTPGDSLKNGHSSDAVERNDIIKSPSEVTEQIEKIKTSRKITKTLPKIDSFLIHDFNFNIIEEEENLHREPSPNPFLLPMLIEISDPNWDSKVPDYEEFYRTEYMVGCYGSIETVKALSKDPDVIRVKGADVGYELEVEQSISITTLSLDKIDSFLVNDFSFNLRKRKGSNTQEAPFLLPMVIEISNPNWKSKMPLSHHKEFHRSDHMVACYGSIEDVKALNDDPEVICVEAADVG